MFVELIVNCILYFTHHTSHLTPQKMSFKISLENFGKKFNYEWIFRGFSYEFVSGEAYAITGANGSGKSTFLQCLAGFFPQSEGKIIYSQNNENIDKNIDKNTNKIILGEDFYRYLSFAAPYQELIEEFTLLEQINFHQKFKKFSQNQTSKEIIKKLRLESSEGKFIKNFSSGMKQRLKLGLALYAQTPVLLLDEPTTNLDTENINWYKTEIKENLSERLVIVCSNDANEYDFCKNIIKIS